MGSMAKDMGSFASTSTMRSKSKKNKLSKKKKGFFEEKKWEADWRNISWTIQSNEKSVGVNCKKFIPNDDQQEMITKPLQVCYNLSPPGKVTDERIIECAFNTDPVLPSNESDEYEVVNSEDEFDKDHPNNEEEDDGTSQKRDQDFSPTYDDNILHEELHYWTVGSFTKRSTPKQFQVHKYKENHTCQCM